MRWLKKVLTGRKEGHGGLKEIHAATDLRGAAEKETTGRWSFVKQRKSGVDGGKRSSDQPPVAVAEPSQGRLCRCAAGVEVRAREEAAALEIQKAFRGYLARKALRALRSLVKLQALVRGYLVRKQATTTLHRLQALMRLQADTYAVKRDSYRKSTEQERIVAQDARTKPSHRRRLSDSTDSNYEQRGSPRIVEMDTCQLRCRSSRIPSRHAAADPAPPLSSPLPCFFYQKPTPSRLHELETPRPQPKTTQNTPRLGALPPAGIICGGVSPAKGRSSCVGGRESSSSPRYMADTASSVARTSSRCQSAPRTRQSAHAAPVEPKAPGLARSGSRKAQPQDSFSFKSSEASRMEDYSEISDEVTRDYYLDQLW